MKRLILLGTMALVMGLCAKHFFTSEDVAIVAEPTAKAVDWAEDVLGSLSKKEQLTYYFGYNFGEQWFCRVSGSTLGENDPCSQIHMTVEVKNLLSKEECDADPAKCKERKECRGDDAHCVLHGEWAESRTRSRAYISENGTIDSEGFRLDNTSFEVSLVIQSPEDLSGKEYEGTLACQTYRQATIRCKGGTTFQTLDKDGKKTMAKEDLFIGNLPL